jgi:6-pyruvoyltetrahydropterin/6-carboxytetrahydropterin synthase
MYRSSKTYGHEQGLSSCFRQWRAKSHCRFFHGYALSFKFIFEAEELDSNNWVVDFGSLKPLKQQLVDVFDHKTLVAYDDPQIEHMMSFERVGLMQVVCVPDVGCEAFALKGAQLAKAFLQESGLTPRVRLVCCEVREHAGNSGVWVATQ